MRRSMRFVFGILLTMMAAVSSQAATIFEFVVTLRKQRQVEAESLGDAAGFLVAMPVAPALRIVAHDKNAGLGQARD